MTARADASAQCHGPRLFPLRLNARAIAILDDRVLEGRVTGLTRGRVWLTCPGERQETTPVVPRHRVIALWEESP